jgi:cytochrome c biogenesis protein CcmG/thiol:disulfide interchange protein DsbE
MIPTDELEGYPKRTSLRRIALPLVGVLAIAALSYGILKPAKTTDGAGNTAPSFELELLSGEGTLSDSDLRGKPVVLNFWASWCYPCREEMPLFEDSSKEYAGRITFVGVLVRDTVESARAFVRNHHITYPIVWDPDQTLAHALGVSPLPETFFIDPSWHLIEGVTQESIDGSGGQRTFGAIEEDQLQERIDALLEGAP